MSEALGCSHVTKICGNGIVANHDISLSVEKGEIHAIIGENGAGKSTLMRGLYGIDPPDRGEVRLRGQVVARPSVEESIRRRVGMVHQHFLLVPTLTVAENVVLGQEPLRNGLLDTQRAAREVSALGEKYRLAVDPTRLAGELSVGELQRVEIVKVLWRGAEVLILDEPTAVLTPREVDDLFSVLRDLARDGKTVVLVTHKLDEVLAIAQQVTVLRRGEVIESRSTAGASARDLARAMVGRDVLLSGEHAAPVAAGAQPRLIVERLSVARKDGTLAVDGVNLEVRAGEILGVAGVEGNGQTELALALCGVLPAKQGRVRLDGVDLSTASVRARKQAGLAHIPEDRQGRGLLLDFSVEENLLLGANGGGWSIDRRALRQEAERLIARLDVRPPDPTAPASSLSGGNQQKIVVGRELLGKPRALVCAQPTRGVDVGAIERIHQELLSVRASGAAVLLLSAELDELLQLADRIVVLYRGTVVGQVENDGSRRAALRERLGALMLGAKEAA